VLVLSIDAINRFPLVITVVVGTKGEAFRQPQQANSAIMSWSRSNTPFGSEQSLTWARRFERGLREHIEREDLDFFPEIERWLSPDQRAEAGRRMAQLRTRPGNSSGT
jgi:hypothetical protein